MITIAILKAIAPKCSDKAEKFVPWFNKYMGEYGIDTDARQCAFLAQLAHESGEFRYVRELGSDDYLEKYDTGSLAARLGNTQADDGDGQKYRGRGLIQITGRYNYEICGKALGLDLISHPELLEQPEWAVASACWFWSALKGLNALADKGNFLGITKRINGGQNGQQQRVEFWERAKKAISSGV